MEKPTNIWISEFARVPVGNTSNLRCQERCGTGKINESTGGYIHDAVIAGRGDGPIVTSNVRKSKCSVPEQVLQEILLAASTTERSHRRIVIDLFAGYGSMQEVAEERGLAYVAVDVKDSMKSDEYKKRSLCERNTYRLVLKYQDGPSWKVGGPDADNALKYDKRGML